MILVDTSIWIDHLCTRDDRLCVLLDAAETGIHPLVVQELAIGRIARRAELLDLLRALSRIPVLQPEEVLALVEARRLWGRGLSSPTPISSGPRS